MTGTTGRPVARALVTTWLLVAATAGCSSGPVEPGTGDARGVEGPVAYCSGNGGDDAAFWDLVHSSCAGATDGDVEQAEALRSALDELGTDEVAAFHRTFTRLDRALRGASDVADAICAPGLGLGPDLGSDYRSWIIAHGQAAYEAVLDDPDRLRDFPDARVGCGLGEPFGFAAATVYEERTGRLPGRDG